MDIILTNTVYSIAYPSLFTGALEASEGVDTGCMYGTVVGIHLTLIKIY